MDHAVPLPPPVLDHVVIDVRDRMDEAARTFAALGFQLTPRGHHTLGSMNHLMMFATDYLELLGFGEGGASRPELAPFPVGLNGLVFKTADADAVHAHAAAVGLPILPVQSFSRPVEFDGARQDARFRTTRLDPGKIAMGRVYFCEHLTPELVWRPEWQVASERRPRDLPGRRRDPRPAGDRLAVPRPVRADGGHATRAEVRGRSRHGAGRADDAGRHRGGIRRAAPEAAGRSEYLAALEMKVGSLADTAERLRGVAGVRSSRSRVVVPARAAFNTTLVFSA